MKKIWTKLISFGMAVMLLTGSLSLTAFAEESEQPAVITGTYHFSSIKDSGEQLEDSFVYRDACFLQSSFEECGHLRTLSIQAGLAAFSRYGGPEDPYCADYSNCSGNILQMLTDMGFENAEANAYYNISAETNSSAVAVGSRTLSYGNENCTILGIFPRCVGYKQEWAGNAVIGTGDVHKGFLEARDEVLRFVKQYIQEHEIQGKLKLWIAGLSRAGAVANLLGGYFAGGGSYLGDAVSIAPEDIYCYTFNTPRVIVSDASKNTVFSVSGSRGGVYAADTPGNDYIYAAGGTVDLSDSVYGGMHDYSNSYDLVGTIPLESWGYTRYGTTESSDSDGNVAAETMLEELQAISPDVYDEYTSGGDVREFRELTFSLRDGGFIPVEGGLAGEEGMKTYGAIGSAVFARLMPTQTAYVEQGYENAAAAMFGIVGLGKAFGLELKLSAPTLIIPTIDSYYAYASEQLQKEGRANSEAEAVLIATIELLEYFTGEDIDISGLTLDKLTETVMKCLADHQDSDVVKAILAEIEKRIAASNYEIVVRNMLAGFSPKKDSSEPASLTELLTELIYACAYGPKEGTVAAEVFQTAAKCRGIIYTLASVALAEKVPNIRSLIGTDNTGSLNGSGPAAGIVEMILKQFLEVKEKGKVVKTYASLAEKADAGLAKALQTFVTLVSTTIQCRGIFSEEYINDLNGYLDMAKANITQLRTIIIHYMIHSEDGTFSTAQNMNNIFTLAGNLNVISCGHYGEVALAWAKAAGKNEEEHTLPEPSVTDIFVDVNEGDWFVEPVEFIYNYKNENGERLMSGYADGIHFGPADPMTRGQFAVLLYRYENSPETVFDSTVFPDVDESLFFAQAAIWANSKGYITGYQNGCFGGTDFINREQLVTILCRYAKAVLGEEAVSSAAASADLNGFSDTASVTAFAQESMKWAVGAGIISGKADGTLSPQASAARAECAAMFQRFIAYCIAQQSA